MPPLAPLITLSTAELAVLRTSRTCIPVDDAVFRIDGDGAIACLQGLLTNDVAKLADGAAAWGAFLTPKGMIVTDAWVVRDGASAWVVVPSTAHETTRQLFARTMPPRIAKVSDLSATIQVRWLCGGSPSPLEGATFARPREAAPFTVMMLTQAPAGHEASLVEQGWAVVPGGHADVVRLLAGWPALGREIDDRTLPQEVRFDALGGVKYDKGCYTGQETVARLHFRGHANRELRGVCWAPGERPTDASVSDGEKAVGTLRTLVQLGDRSFALSLLRREVGVGDTVRTGDSEGIVVEPPFDLGDAAVA
jgi:tRNA-modifying protein YgfZ